MLTSYVHPRLGQKKFELFQPWFLDALERLDQGQETKFDFKNGLSPSTVAARMRDSLQGYRLNKWDCATPRFVELFNKHDGKFVVAGPDLENNVYFRFKHARGRQSGDKPYHVLEGQLPTHMQARAAERTVLNTAVPQPLRAKSCDTLVVEQYGKLKGIGEIDVAVIFPGPVEPSIIERLTSTFDLAFQFYPERNETIML